jgi:protein-tyrosine phosphatase
VSRQVPEVRAELEQAESFRILVVCTGNIARSPMAQRLLEHRLLAVPSLSVSSAGTWGHEGSPMERSAAAALAEVGIDEGGFRARELTLGMVRSAALVLTATRDHRAAVLRHDPTALRRTFTLRELARLAALPVAASELQPGPARAHRVVEAAAGARGSVRVPPREDDVADPFGAPLSVYRACRDQIRVAVDQIASALVGRHDQ